MIRCTQVRFVGEAAELNCADNDKRLATVVLTDVTAAGLFFGMTACCRLAADWIPLFCCSWPMVMNEPVLPSVRQTTTIDRYQEKSVRATLSSSSASDARSSAAGAAVQRSR